MTCGRTYVLVATDDIPSARRAFRERLGRDLTPADEVVVCFPAGTGAVWARDPRGGNGDGVWCPRQDEAAGARRAEPPCGAARTEACGGPAGGRSFVFRDRDGRRRRAWVPRTPAA